MAEQDMTADAVTPAQDIYIGATDAGGGGVPLLVLSTHDLRIGTPLTPDLAAHLVEACSAILKQR